MESYGNVGPPLHERLSTSADSNVMTAKRVLTLLDNLDGLTKEMTNRARVPAPKLATAAPSYPPGGTEPRTTQSGAPTPTGQARRWLVLLLWVAIGAVATVAATRAGWMGDGSEAGLFKALAVSLLAAASVALYSVIFQSSRKVLAAAGGAFVVVYGVAQAIVDHL
jgi:hypothetical protein